jgi:hypothetical protein
MRDTNPSVLIIDDDPEFRDSVVWGGYCGQSGWTLSNFHLLLSFSMPIPILTARPASCST